MKKNICVIGRFQPLHWGHYEYIMEATKISNNLIIGITNPYDNYVYFHESNTLRCLPDSNPFTYNERCSMIEKTFRFLSPYIDYEIKPCVLGSSNELTSSLGKNLSIALTIYDKWGEHRLTLFKNAGYEIHLLWERKEKITSGSEVRERIRNNKEWEHLVPNGCKEVLKGIVSKRKI